MRKIGWFYYFSWQSSLFWQSISLFWLPHVIRKRKRKNFLPIWSKVYFGQLKSRLLRSEIKINRIIRLLSLRFTRDYISQKLSRFGRKPHDIRKLYSTKFPPIFTDQSLFWVDPYRGRRGVYYSLRNYYCTYLQVRLQAYNLSQRLLHKLPSTKAREMAWCDICRDNVTGPLLCTLRRPQSAQCGRYMRNIP